MRGHERKVSVARAGAAVGWALLTLSAAACGGEEPASSPMPVAVASPSPTPSPSPSPSRPPSPSATDLAVDPTVIPEEGAITVAYAQAVIDALDEQLGELARLAVAEGVEDEAVVGGLSRIYGGEAYATARAGWRDYLGPRFGDRPEGPDTTVTELVTATRTCVSVRADRSLDPFGPEVEFSGSGWFLALEPSEDGPGSGNPTAWRITFEGIPADETVEMEDPCAT